MSKISLDSLKQSLKSKVITSPSGITLKTSTFQAEITDVYGEEAVSKSGKPYTKIVLEMVKLPKRQPIKWSMPSFLASTARHLEVLEVGQTYTLTIEPVGQGLELTSVVSARGE